MLAAQQTSSHYFRTCECVVTLSEVLEVLTLLQKDIHMTKTEKKSPSPGIILLLSSEESWRKRGRVNERCEREGTGEEEEKDGERERDGGLSLRIYLSKTPTLRF